MPYKRERKTGRLVTKDGLPSKFDREQDQAALFYEIIRAAAGGNFKAFCNLVLGDEYVMNWHHEALIEHLEAVHNREIMNLMVMMGPRRGKSWHVSQAYPSFNAIRRPERRSVISSYSGDLANLMNRGAQRILESPLIPLIVPQFAMNNPEQGRFSNLKRTDTVVEFGRREIIEGGEDVVRPSGGSIRSVGFGGSLTGMGYDDGIIDDPFKGPKEADSLTMRDFVWNWYTQVFLLRAQKGAAKIVCQTRWHEDDLCGRLLNTEAKDWTVLKLPEIATEKTPEEPRPYDIREPGQLLWPDFFDEKRVAADRKTMGERAFQALFQQTPTSPAGQIIKRVWLTKFWKELPIRQTQWLASWDCAFSKTEGSSYIVGTVWCSVDGEFYLVDRVRDRMEFIETIAAIRALSAKWPKAGLKLVENKANGPAVISTLKKEIPGLVAVEVDRSKEARLRAVSPYFESGNVILPDPSIAPWVSEYIEELVTFPQGANDDQVDSTSQALERLSGGGASWLAKMTTR